MSETVEERRCRLNRERQRCYAVLKGELRRGNVVKPSTCARCGGTGERIEAHHKDHAKPLDVEWLCSVCHGAERRVKESYVST